MSITNNTIRVRYIVKKTSLIKRTQWIKIIHNRKATDNIKQQPGEISLVDLQ